MRKLLLLLLIGVFLTALSCTTVVRPGPPGLHRPHPQHPHPHKSWVPGHHNHHGVWVPGHWRHR